MAGPTVVKRTQGTEDYDDRKVYSSVVAACMDYGMDTEEAQDIAGEVVDAVTEKVEAREQVLSVEIRMWVRNELKEHDRGAAEHYYRS